MSILDRLPSVSIPAASRIAVSGEGFPRVEGSNLERETFVLPRDLGGELNLLLLAFKQVQQARIDQWMPIAQRLEREVDGLLYYELPVLDSFVAPARLWINEGMRAGIPDPTARARTITLYLEDKAAFMRAIDLPTEDSIYALLVSRDGQILWRAQGLPTERATQALQEAVEKI